MNLIDREFSSKPSPRQLALEMRSNVGKQFTIKGWLIDVCRDHFLITNTFPIYSQGHFPETIDLGFNVKDVAEKVVYQCDIDRTWKSISGYVFIIAANKTNQRILPTILADTYNNISVQFIGGDAIAPGGLEIILTPVYPLEITDISSQIKLKKDVNTSNIKVVHALQEHCKYRLFFVGQATKTAPFTYELFCTLPQINEFVQIKNMQFYEVEKYDQSDEECEQLPMMFRDCSIYKVSEKIYQIIISVTSDKYPDTIIIESTLSSHSNANVCVFSKFPYLKLTEQMGWVVPLSSKEDIFIEKNKSAEVVINNNFYKSPEVKEPLVFIVGGTNMEKDFAVKDVTWTEHSDITLSLLNCTENDLTIQAGTIIAAAVPAVLRNPEYSDGVRVFLDNQSRPFCWQFEEILIPPLCLGEAYKSFASHPDYI
ncbi:protein G10 [Vespertilionid gammaherpesvirus 1]|uniref:Protein G10 n=1 Tax=Vespertilionid gammaherpesvirus 1 TaxID=2560830 RepID=A0A0X9XZR9_9GAMA|nr:protein G10 [Myotis gammaherpesvirus 8]AMA67371.1 protein G10 [Vespertilionid gammaherpesvirus 1]